MHQRTITTSGYPRSRPPLDWSNWRWQPRPIRNGSDLWRSTVTKWPLPTKAPPSICSPRCHIRLISPSAATAPTNPVAIDPCYASYSMSEAQKSNRLLVDCRIIVGCDGVSLLMVEYAFIRCEVLPGIATENDLFELVPFTGKAIHRRNGHFRR